MAFLLSRTDIPVLSLGIVQDDAFTAGDTSAWAAIWRTALRSARGQGTPLDGRVRIAHNMVARVIGPSAPPLDSPLQHLVTLSLEYDGIQIWADNSLADDSCVMD